MSDQKSYVTIDILGPLVKGKYLILGFALLAVGGGMVREYLAPMRYESNASILVVANDAQSSTIQSLLGAKGPSMLGLISGIITSRNVREKISTDNKIALEDLDAKFKIETSPEANKIEFIAYGDTREKADSINRTAIRALDDLNSTLGISVSKKRADSVKSALDARQTELDKAQQDLADFQRKMKTPVDPDKP
ncbi:MAG TPA: Wzz/FepE/Etk N-terminal domain-containing protein, partial [Fimbriimonas sp.]|nr:Wzz/FepE/Etk N-terminal domain-containing protein [Fimbriimonas sp.]